MWSVPPAEPSSSRVPASRLWRSWPASGLRQMRPVARARCTSGRLPMGWRDVPNEVTAKGFRNADGLKARPSGPTTARHQSRSWIVYSSTWDRLGNAQKISASKEDSNRAIRGPGSRPRSRVKEALRRASRFRRGFRLRRPGLAASRLGRGRTGRGGASAGRENAEGPGLRRREERSGGAADKAGGRGHPHHAGSHLQDSGRSSAWKPSLSRHDRRRPGPVRPERLLERLHSRLPGAPPASGSSKDHHG